MPPGSGGARRWPGRARARPRRIVRFLSASSRVVRTNIDIDDRLIASVMQRYGLRTKREAVDLALRRLVGEPLETGEILQLEGSGWQADLDEIRTSRVANDR